MAGQASCGCSGRGRLVLLQVSARARVATTGPEAAAQGLSHAPAYQMSFRCSASHTWLLISDFARYCLRLAFATVLSYSVLPELQAKWMQHH